jgi:hypothetical protein
MTILENDREAERVGCRSCQAPTGVPCRDRIGRDIRPHRARVLDALGLTPRRSTKP